MITKIRKRDGREVPFNIEKIANAIYKAAQAAGGQDYETSVKLAEEVALHINDEYKGQVPSVENIQDMVEKILIEKGHARTSKEYILYRAERSRVREMDSRLMKIYDDLTFKDAKDVNIKRENANIDGNTAMGTMLKYGSEGAKTFYDLFVLNPEHSKAHKNGDFHIHDLDFLTLTTTCCQIDLIKLFENGFSTGHGFLREPQDIHSYCALACIAIQSNQNDQHGGQSIPNFDYAMSLGVKKTYKKMYRINLLKTIDFLSEDVSLKENVENIFKILEDEYLLEPTISNNKLYIEKEKEHLIELLNEEDLVDKIQKFTKENAYNDTNRRTYQAMEALIHNLNTMHSRAGAQIPFSSINYGTDTSEEGRLVMKNLLLATDRGLGNGETPIFPIQIFKVKDGINYKEDDINYDLFKLACKVSSKRLFPNFSFIDAPFNLEYYKPNKPETEVAYMGCRTRVIGNVYDRDKEIVNGRGNLSFTTINLPRLGINNKNNIEGFYTDLETTINITVEQLIERFEIQARKKVKNYPFLMGQGIWIDSEKLNQEDEVREVLKHGTLSVGFIGLAECLKALIGEHHGESDDAQKLGLEIIGFMREMLDNISDQYKMNFTLIGTPAEGTSGRFVKIDKEKYGLIKGVTDREYYTNSFHIPVYYEISAYEKITKEAPYHALTNAGHITYVELDGDPSMNPEAFERVVRCMKESGIGYGSINHPVDRDPVCGYTGVIEDVCPKCGRSEGDIKFERIRRITGYLVGTLDRFNDAKKAEERDRVKHLSCK